MPNQGQTQIVTRSKLCIIALSLIFGIIFVAVGAKLIQRSSRTESKELVIDYTNCMQHVFNQVGIRCIDYKLPDPVCVCQQAFEVPEPLIGDVVLYYELDSDVQSKESYLKSRDDLQLSGQLSQEPAAQCEPYRYDNGKPIAPCGEIADTLFTDKYWLRRPYEDAMNVSYDGMLKHKGNYRNPQWNNSYPLEKVFKDFAKPKSWTHNIWELDTANVNNNGFENERFIGWMDTTLKRKPAWRLDSSYEGLQNGSYVLRIEYSYPPSKYNGTRKVVFVSSRSFQDSSSYGGGIAMVVIGVLSLVIFLAAIAFITFIYWSNRGKETERDKETEHNDAIGGLMNL